MVNEIDSNKVILEFFKEVRTQVNKMKGFIVMDSLEDASESIVLTFWESKEFMDSFYQADNRLLSDLVDKDLNPLLKLYQKDEVIMFQI